MFILVAAAIDPTGWPWYAKLLCGLAMLAAFFYFASGPKTKK